VIQKDLSELALSRITADHDVACVSADAAGDFPTIALNEVLCVIAVKRFQNASHNECQPFQAIILTLFQHI